jgi:hypothetical protein
MAHRRLCGPRRHPALAEQRAERGPQRVNVEGPAAVIPLRDAGQFQVAVENPQQPGRHVEKG